MKAVIYARVSSREQEETGYSLPAQEKLLRDYAERQGLKVTKTFSVAESASGAKQRQVFAEMMDYMSREQVPHLLCEKVDRLTRNLKEAVVANDWVEADPGRKIHFVKQSLVIHKNAKSDEKFRWDIEIVLAKKFIANLSEEVKKGQKEKLAQGWLPTKPPLGYKTVGEKGKRIHVIDEAAAVYVREMFSLYASGKYSLAELCKVMKARGLRTGKGYGLVKSRMASLLSDPFYYGALRWNDAVHDTGKHEPLISKTLFDEVQRVMHRGYSPKYSKHLYTFMGSLRCLDCQGLITWEKHKGIVYGHCNTYRNCVPRPWYKEKEIIEQLAGAFEKLVVKSKRIADWLVKVLRDNNRDEEEFRKAHVTRLQAQVSRIETKLSQAYEDRLDGRISTEQYDNKATQLTEERKALQAEIGRYHDTGDKTKDLRIKVYELSQAAPEIFQKADVEKRRTLLGLVFEKLEMVNGEVEYTFKEPFAALAKAAKETNSSKMPEMLTSSTAIFELVNGGSTKEQSEAFDLARSVLLHMLHEVRTHALASE